MQKEKHFCVGRESTDSLLVLFMIDFLVQVNLHPGLVDFWLIGHWQRRILPLNHLEGVSDGRMMRWIDVSTHQRLYPDWMET